MPEAWRIRQCRHRPRQKDHRREHRTSAGEARAEACVVTTARSLAEALRRDRVERIARKPVRKSTTTPEPEFDPFAIARWRVIAGGDPGYLVKTPMRRGPIGWFIPCRACAMEFESKGWAYCPACMALPAEEGRDHELVQRVGRPCARPDCDERLSKHARADAVYCSAACRKAASRDKSGGPLPPMPGPEMSQLEAPEAQQNRGSKTVLIGMTDFPINVIGGYRWPEAKTKPLERVRVRPWVE